MSPFADAVLNGVLLRKDMVVKIAVFGFGRRKTEWRIFRNFAARRVQQFLVSDSAVDRRSVR